MKEIHNVCLSEGEEVIREYNASYIQKPKTQGYIIATNRRLIFTGSSQDILGESMIFRDTKIDQITGMAAEIAYGKSIWRIMVGSIIAIICLLVLFSHIFEYMPFFRNVTLVVLLFSIYMVYSAIKFPGVVMGLNIMTSGQSSSAISVAVKTDTSFLKRVFGKGGNNAWLSIAASAPGLHTDRMIRELSALIQDIQINGDLAINKWKDIPLKSNEKQIPSNQTFEKIKETAASKLVEVSNKVKDSKSIINTNSENSEDGYTDICSNCGLTVKPEAKFCGKCGHKLENQNTKKVEDESFFS